MNYFFDSNNVLGNNVDWFFNINHLMLVLSIIAFIVMCVFLFRAKTEKGKKITRIFLAIILLIFEVGRTVYKYINHINNGGTAENFNWWWNISFQMCAIMCWTTIATLILSVFLNKENKFLQFLYNILFGCAMIGGILTFCYPDCISENYPILHFVNFQTILVHSLLIFVPIYLIVSKQFKVEIKNIWKVATGYIYIGSIAMTASIISGNNFAFSLKFDLIDLGIAFPWHLPVIMLVLVALSTVIYGIFELVRFIKTKKESNSQRPIKDVTNNKLTKATAIVANICGVLFGAFIVLGTASLIGKDNKTLLGLFCLLGLVYIILLLTFANYHLKNANTNLQKSWKHIILICLTLVFALPVGILYLIDYTRISKTNLSK
ncbi:MAG: hypothetical protein ACI4PF_06545 [Christensenellales bacterium]